MRPARPKISRASAAIKKSEAGPARLLKKSEAGPARLLKKSEAGPARLLNRDKPRHPGRPSTIDGQTRQ
jgi:hypothetical protein